MRKEMIKSLKIVFFGIAMFSVNAHAAPIRQDITIARLNAPNMRDAVFARLVRDLRGRFRRELNVDLRVTVKIGNDPFKPISVTELSKKFARYVGLASRKGWATRRRIALVLAPPTLDDYSWGWANQECARAETFTDGSIGGVGVATVGAQEKNRENQDRFCYASIAVAHEIAHLLGATHTSNRDLGSIMHPDAGRNACTGQIVVFRKSSKKEITSCLRG